MVIDFHTHAFPDAIAGRAIKSLCEGCGNKYTPCHNGTLAGLKKNMKNFGVDLSVVQPVMTNPRHFKTMNDWAKEICGDGIISFGALHPETEDYKKDIDYICSLGLRGIKFHPEYQHFTIDTKEMLKIYSYALEKGLILLFHAGFDPAFPPPYHSSPRQFNNLWRELGGGTIVAAHLGGQKQWDEVPEFIGPTGIYIDTSMGFDYYSKEQFFRILSTLKSERILFGSDAPWSRADKEIAAIKALDIPEADKQKILHINAEKLLGN